MAIHSLVRLKQAIPCRILSIWLAGGGAVSLETAIVDTEKALQRRTIHSMIIDMCEKLATFARSSGSRFVNAGKIRAGCGIPLAFSICRGTDRRYGFAQIPDSLPRVTFRW